MLDWRGLHDPDTASDDGELPVLSRDRSTSTWWLAIEIPALILVAALLAIGFKATVAQAYSIPSGSMEPQLAVGDRVLVSRLAYRLHDPNRGDVVVFHDPVGAPRGDDSFIVARYGRDALEALGIVEPEDTELIKRVVGLPGETVEARDGAVYVEGRRLFEPYLPDDVVQTDFGVIVVPDGHVFVMGDHRDNSKDSREFGPVPVDSIVGRAIAIVWPPTRVAYL